MGRVWVLAWILLGWSLAFGAPPDGSGDVPAVKVVEKVEVVPDDLTVTVYSHTFTACQGAVNAWTFVTEGLSRYGQAEMVFTETCSPIENVTLMARVLAGASLR